MRSLGAALGAMRAELFVNMSPPRLSDSRFAGMAARFDQVCVPSHRLRAAELTSLQVFGTTVLPGNDLCGLGIEPVEHGVVFIGMATS